MCVVGENADFRVFNKISENVEKDSYIRNNMEGEKLLSLRY